MPPCEVRSTARKVNSTIYGKSSAKFIVEKGHVHTRLSNKLHAPRGENKCGTSDSGYVHRTVTHFLGHALTQIYIYIYVQGLLPKGVALGQRLALIFFMMVPE